MLCRTRSTGALSGRRWHASSQRNQSSPKVPPSGVGATVRWYLACTAKLRSVTAQHRELGDGSKIHLLMRYCVLSERIATVPHMVLNAKPCCSWAGWNGATSTPRGCTARLAIPWVQIPVSNVSARLGTHRLQGSAEGRAGKAWASRVCRDYFWQALPTALCC